MNIGTITDAELTLFNDKLYDSMIRPIDINNSRMTYLSKNVAIICILLIVSKFMRKIPHIEKIAHVPP